MPLTAVLLLHQHEWLEERAGRGCLMHIVDDATSTAEGRFSPEETIWAAVGVLRSWIEKYGIPRALYTDGKNVYVREATESEKQVGIEPLTQFGRMCRQMGVRIVAANSPQAKGAGGTGARHPPGPGAPGKPAVGWLGWRTGC